MSALLKRSILGISLLLVGSPAFAQAQAQSEPLIPGLSDAWLLIYLLAGGVLMLFACILTLTYMLYKSIPILVEKQKQKEQLAS